ncbi:MAG: glycine cleavage system aminomethyltransferase GcvT [Victivallaceae bacterium]|nr:glycine cleavage system aminomethyltransferase GcvT [Victivallaceae bacterium]MDD3116761.1 glycine cleavage system aminomethyltransferase GcvT [Victivallaceae bacterium]MDD3704212.1 glycine cleavage system aminomethyltransferase GcvT [Victivallaceae bacterium]MDD4316913.1 glycine cleavage system aminomethyltransferase GcvT [Victivallaceae bacterium]NLK82519.1 glycine cleavage system aminomethyltransferase GcvT [Lentisphaerota bacterium]
MSEELKSTVLCNEHMTLNARMVPFSGWNMPVQYAEGILAEHQHTREHVSLFDICHMGEIKVFGKGAREALDKILARPVFDQSLGSCRYNFLLNDAGGVIDDLIVYYLGEDDYFIVTNAARRDDDVAQIRKHLPNGIELVDISDETAKLDLQGPESATVISELTGLQICELPKYFRWQWVEIDGIRVLLSRTGYTGELGFELYFPMDKAVTLWRRLLQFKNVKPAGLGARDTLRLEMGMALYGHELNLETTPLEAGYGFMLKMEDFPSREFIGRKALENTPGERELVAVYLEGRRAAREHTELLDINQNTIGIVTSGGFAPSLGHAIALAYVSKGSVNKNDAVFLNVGKSQIQGKIGGLPFYTNGTARNKI